MTVRAGLGFNSLPNSKFLGHVKNNKKMIVQTLLPVTKKLQCSPPHVGFVCPTANRFASLALDIEEQNTDCDLRIETDQYSNTNVLELPKHSVKVCQKSKNVKKDHSIHIGQNALQDCQKGGQNCQKQSKMCPGAAEDKYDLGLQVKMHNKYKLDQGNSDTTYKIWWEQTEDKFGFIPLGPLVMPSDKRRHCGSNPIKLSDITRNETTFNFLSAQIQLDSQLNVDM